MWSFRNTLPGHTTHAESSAVSLVPYIGCEATSSMAIGKSDWVISTLHYVPPPGQTGVVGHTTCIAHTVHFSIFFTLGTSLASSFPCVVCLVVTIRV